MGKKSKSKNKLAKMSDEERARYLQQRADIEEEARRRKQHLIALYMKNKLKREEAFCRLNLAKINQEWRSILRQIKCQDLKHEMMEVEKYFRIALERKDRIIHQLLSELDIAEDMYATLQQSQMEIVRKMISTQNARMEFFRDQYSKEKTAILQECRDAFSQFKANRDRAQEQLECVVYTLEDKNTASAKQRHEDHLVLLYDIRSSMTLQLEEITNEREKKLETLWSQYQEALNNYVKYTESFYAEYVDLKERDDVSSNIIRDQAYEIEKATEQIERLKIAVANATEEADAEVAYIQKVRNDLADRLSHMKKEFAANMKSEKTAFRVMSVASHNALKDLEKIAKQGEMIMQLATVCRRFETENEKILPFGLPKNSFEDTEEESSEPPKGLQGAVLLIWTSMEKFWYRVNKARVDVAALKREKTDLAVENAKLKAQLQDYLVEMNIQAGSNSHVNDYVAKRPASMMVERVAGFELEKSANQRRVRRPYTCVEGNLSNAVRSKHLVAGKPTTVRIMSIVRPRS